MHLKGCEAKEEFVMEGFFSNRDLKNMIMPLFLEQMLLLLVGMADTLIVSYVGETAVSGVSLVNQFNTVFIFLFTALASRGAVLISQYIGKKTIRGQEKHPVSCFYFLRYFPLLCQ